MGSHNLWLCVVGHNFKRGGGIACVCLRFSALLAVANEKNRLLAHQNPKRCSEAGNNFLPMVLLKTKSPTRAFSLDLRTSSMIT